MSAVVSTPPFGQPARALFSLAQGAAFLNHGSYGAVPLVAQEAQRRLRAEMERSPDEFFERIQPTGPEQAPRRIAGALAGLLATSADRIALAENTTSGVEAVLDSFPLAPGDEVLITDQQYNAVRLGVLRRCRAAGARARIAAIPLPATRESTVRAVLEAVGPATRIAVLDHITSGSAMVLPVEQIIPALRERGVAVLLDGAHCIGQVPLNLPALGADWYVTNAHKWLYAPRGSALVWSSPTAPVQPLPLVTSHYVGLGFPRAFDYIGTRDYTAWLATAEAIGFFEVQQAQGLWAWEAALVDVGSRAMIAAGAQPLAPRDMCAAMRAFQLPQRREATEADGDAVVEALWSRERIRIRCVANAGRLLLRFSAQAYVTEEELRRLGEALDRHGWPARA